MHCPALFPSMRIFPALQWHKNSPGVPYTRMRCVGWPAKYEKAKCSFSFIHFPLKLGTQSILTALSICTFSLKGPYTMPNQLTPVEKVKKSELLSEMPTKKLEQKATVCPHIPHCFVQMRARCPAWPECEDKDLVWGRRAGEQTKENKERFPNWADRRSRQQQGPGNS